MVTVPSRVDITKFYISMHGNKHVGISFPSIKKKTRANLQGKCISLLLFLYKLKSTFDKHKLDKMRKHHLLGAILLCGGLFSCSSEVIQQANYEIIPLPQEIKNQYW